MEDRQRGGERQRREVAGAGRSGDGPGCVVVGWDGSASSSRALAYASGMARRSAQRLLAVQVCPAVPSSDWYGVAAAALAEAERSASAAMPAAVAGALDERLARRWKAVTVYGEVASELARTAQASHADVLVVGKGEHSRWRMRTVAQRLVRRSPCPLVVVP